MPTSSANFPLVNYMSAASLQRMKPSTKYAARKKREERERMRSRGFILRQLWAHPADWPSISALSAALRGRRD
jgi:hypothetical protein